MFLHIGGNDIVDIKNIIAIVDIEKGKKSSINKEFFKIAKEEEFVINKLNDPKTYIITEKKFGNNNFKRGKIKTQIYLSNISVKTLLMRIEKKTKEILKNNVKK